MENCKAATQKKYIKNIYKYKQKIIIIRENIENKLFVKNKKLF